MSFYLVQWNARSVHNKKIWLEQFFFRNAKIIAIQETFLNKSDVDFSLSGKNIFRNDRPTHGGGLLTAIDSKITAQMVNLTLPQSDIETLTVKLQIKNVSIHLINLYSPKGIFTKQWLTALLAAVPRPFIIVGDFNCKNTALGASKNSRRSDVLIDFLIENNLCLLNTKDPTHFTAGRSSSLIDLSIASSDFYSSLSYKVSLDTYNSDHAPIQIFFNDFTSRSSHIKKFTNWTLYERNVNTALGSCSENSINALQAICQRTLKLSVANCVIPDKKYPVWWTSKCSYLQALKRKHLRLAKTLLCRDHWIAYKKFSAKLRRHIKWVKRKFWEETCTDNFKNGSLFKIIKSLKNREVSDNQPVNTLTIANISTTDPDLQSNAFASSFSKPDIHNKLPLDFSEDQPLDINKVFTFEELKAAIGKLKNTSPGNDGITAKAIKSLSQENLGRILDGLNQMWNKCNVPISWKQALVVPIWKKGKPKNEITSYRPISLTSVFCKLFERMLLKRLIEFTESRNTFNKNHFGFIPNRGCDTVLCNIHHSIIQARAKQEYIIGVSLDIKSAYDSVWLEGLSYKLLHTGIRGRAALWIHNFLQNRKIQVRWRKCISNTHGSHIGVPQGAALSPFLFMVYMHDIFLQIPYGVKIYVYADDIFLFYSNKIWKDALSKMQKTLFTIQKWCEEWKLQVVPEKCACINFSSRKIPSELDLEIFSDKIPWTRHIKILGVTFSNTLSFAEHFRQTKKKALRSLQALKVIASPNWGARTDHLRIIANSTIRSILDYGSVVLFSVSDNQRKAYEVMHRAIIRAVYGLPRWTPNPILYKESGEPQMKFRHSFLAAKFFIKHIALYCLSPSFNTLFTYNAKHKIAKSSPVAAEMKLLFGELDINLHNIMPKLKMKELPEFQLYLSGLNFQDKKLPPEIIAALFHDFKVNYLHNYKIIATDASKLGEAISIAAIRIDTNQVLAGRLPSYNSVYTAEGIAILLGLSQLCSQRGNYAVLSDSFSVLCSIKNYSSKSPSIVSQILQKIKMLSQEGIHISMIWVPAHAGIPENEAADHMAKQALGGNLISKIISSDDLIQWFKSFFARKSAELWYNSKYPQLLPYLNSNRLESKWFLDRQSEVLISRLRTKTLPLNSILHKVNLISSPNCDTCKVPETHTHFLLECIRFEKQRNKLRENLGTIPVSFDWLCNFNDNPELKIKSLSKFFKEIEYF